MYLHVTNAIGSLLDGIDPSLSFVDQNRREGQKADALVFFAARQRRTQRLQENLVAVAGRAVRATHELRGPR